MKRSISLALLAIAIAPLPGGCHKPPPRTASAEDARDVAMVERMSKPPAVPVSPDVLTRAAIVQAGYASLPCRFIRAGGPQAGPIFLVGKDIGVLSLEGSLHRMAAETASAPLNAQARSRYVGLKNWVALKRLGGGTETGAGALPTRLEVHDPQERIVFAADGTMACGASAS